MNALNLYGIVNLLAAASADIGPTIRIVRIICIAVLALCALAVIILVLLQPAASEGMGAISGQSYDSFYSKNKVRTPEGIMKRLTIVFSVIMFVVSIVFFVTIIWRGI